MKKVIRFIVKSTLKLIFNIFNNININGLKNLKFDSSSILMPNHVSFLDALILFAYLPDNVGFVINTEMGKKFKFILPFIPHFLVDPLNPYSLKKVIQMLKDGNSLVIFPEGRITTTGNLMKVYGGIALLSIKTDSKIYPIMITGAEYTIFSRLKNKVKQKLFTPLRVDIFKEVKIDITSIKNFRKQKAEIGNKLFIILQDSKFQVKQDLDKDKSIFDKFLESAKINGKNKVIVEDLFSKLTYKKAIISSYALGEKLYKTLGNEDRAGVLLPNSLGNFVTIMGMFYAGKTPAILNFTSGIANNIDCATTTDLKTIFTSKLFIEKAKLDKLISELSVNFKIVYLEDIKQKISALDKISALWKYIVGKKAISNQNNLVLYTSGSENKPKGVVLTQKNLITNVNQMTTVLDLLPNDKMLNALPMFHSFGLTAGTLLPVLNGINVFLYPTPLHYKVIPELVYDRNISLLIGTPSFLMGYAKNAHPYDFTSLRYVIAGGEKLKDDVKQLWSDKFGIRIFEGYGTTETSPVLTVNTPMFYKKGSVGRLLPGIEYKIEEVEGIENGGNLYVSGPNVMHGYLLYEKGFVKSEQWYNCGDIVEIDEEGFLFIKARLKRFAKLSGEMVSLDMVEALATECFQGEKFATISITDQKKGEKIVICTTSDKFNKKDFREFLTNKGYSMLLLPSDIIKLNNLPLLGSGKNDYVKLKKDVEAMKSEN